MTVPPTLSSQTTLDETHLRLGLRLRGKVRDTYVIGDRVALVTSDRLSAFDRSLANIPSKGAVLNLTTAWWMERTRHLVPNALVATPHPNVTIMRRCVPFRVEFVVRAYLTGTTATSIWSHYAAGSRSYCGHALPDGMRKNEPLASVIVTPTTKEEAHDRPISGAEVVSTGLMSASEWETVSSAALAVFAFGQKAAASRGLILVDTKYEFGKDVATGEILLIDEVHTPDSSRYWLAASYDARLAAGTEPENIDKEFLRLWFKANCDPYGDAPLPAAPADLVTELSRRYVQLFTMITGRPASDVLTAEPASEAAISSALEPFFGPAAPALALVVRTGGEEEAGDAEAAAAALVRLLPQAGSGGAVATRAAVELELLNAIDRPSEALALARYCRAGRGVDVSLVLGSKGVGATAGILARHSGGMPTLAVTSATADALSGHAPIACVSSWQSGVAFASKVIGK